MKKTVLFFFLSLFLFLLVSPGPVYAGSPEYDQAYAVYQNQGAAAAAPLFKKIVENTPDPDAMWMLGYIYKNQSNFDTMYAESAKWFKNYLQFPFVKKDFAMHYLGQIYKTGGYGVEKDLAKARIYIETLVESGWSEPNYAVYPIVDLTEVMGQQMAGYTKDDTDYVKAGKAFVKNKPKDALAPLKQSAEYKNPDAMEVLGTMYKYGIGVKQDYFEAASWFRKAAEKELPYSMLNMGKLYDKGNGVTQDDAIARDWYKKSALAGNEEAKTILTEKMTKDPIEPAIAIEMIGKMRYAKDGLPWGEVVNKFILKPKWEYYYNDQEGHVVKLRGYYEDGQKEKNSITIWYYVKCEPNIADGTRAYSIKQLYYAVKDEKSKKGIPDWLAYELE
ncbi:MAG: tetratricopeptide repeat protein [Synergistaceae bacterium]